MARASTLPRYGKKPRIALGQSRTYCRCGVPTMYLDGVAVRTPIGMNQSEGEQCRLRLVRDLVNGEVFSICHHDTISNVMHRREYLNGAPAAPRGDWRLITRPHEKAGLWEAVETNSPDCFEILEG